jgi:hypothetical protein
MVCRDEHITQTNTMGMSHIAQQMRLARIAEIWEDRCMTKHNAWVDEHDRRLDEMEAQKNAEIAFIRKYNAWWGECRVLAKRLEIIAGKFRIHESTLADARRDWDEAVEGKERKAFAIMSLHYPKAMWPRQVPYPDFIAYLVHMEEEMQRALQWQNRYWEVTKVIKQRGHEYRKRNRLVGRNSAGVSLETPSTEKRSSRYRQKPPPNGPGFERGGAMSYSKHKDRLDVSGVIRGPHQEEFNDTPGPSYTSEIEATALNLTLEETTVRARFLGFFECAYYANALDNDICRLRVQELLAEVVVHQGGEARYALARSILAEAWAKVGVQREHECTAQSKGIDGRVCWDCELLEMFICPRSDQPALNEPWDAQAWAASIFEEAGVVTSEQAKDRVARTFDTAVERLLQGTESDTETPSAGVEADDDYEDASSLPYRGRS